MFQALTTLVKNFPKQMDPHLKQVLDQVWNILTQSAERYVKTVVNYTEEADDPVDSDGKKIQYLIADCCHFVNNNLVDLMWTRFELFVVAPFLVFVLFCCCCFFSFLVDFFFFLVLLVVVVVCCAVQVLISNCIVQVNRFNLFSLLR